MSDSEPASNDPNGYANDVGEKPWSNRFTRPPHTSCRAGPVFNFLTLACVSVCPAISLPAVASVVRSSHVMCVASPITPLFT